MTTAAATSIVAVAPATQVTLRVEPDPLVLARLGAAIGVAIPVAPNTASVAGGRAALWMGPDEWLIVDDDRAAAPSIEPALRAAAGDAFVVTVDVSENRVAFDVSGPGARDLLESGTPIDLHPRAFATDSCAQTLLGRANVVIWQRSAAPSYRVFVRPSFAAYLEAWLRDAAEGLAGA